MWISKVHDIANGKPNFGSSISINNINNSCNRVVQVPKSAESVSPQMINLSQLW